MQGRLEVIVGSMFSGKTEALLSRVTRAEIARTPSTLFKHAIDNRYAEVEVVSHSGSRHRAHPVSTVEEMESILKSSPQVVGVDEIQFFDPSFGPYLNSLASRGFRVIVAGLDTDFLGRPFPTTQYVTSVADQVDKVHAVCDSCREDRATRSQLILDGREVTEAVSTVVVGGKETYEARCRACFIT